MADTDLTAALERISAELRTFGAGDEDTRRLIAAVEAVLKLADDWKAEGTKAEDRAQLASGRGDNTACAVLYARATALNQNARGLREAITRELTGKVPGNG